MFLTANNPNMEFKWCTPKERLVADARCGCVRYYNQM